MMMKIINTIAALKVRTNHSVGYLNLFGVPLLIADLIQDKLLLLGIELPFIIIVVVGIIGILIIGFMFDRIGLQEAEISYTSKRNKYLTEIRDSIKN